jgi:hypothetical protein
MGTISDFLEQEFLDHMLKVGSFSPAATLYVGLCDADPTDNASGIDESAGFADTYTRQTIAWNAAGARGVGIVQNGVITFPEAAGAWGTLTHWFICDHQTNTTFGTNVNMYAHGSLNASKAVIAGNTPSIASGEIDVKVSAGKMSDYLAAAMLDWAFDAGTLAVPTSLHVALTDTAIADADTGTTLTSTKEIGMTGYAREQTDNWDAAAGPSPFLSDNTSIIDFGALTGTPETVEGIALLDAATNGNLLFYDNTVSQLIGDGDSVNIPAGDFDISID